MIGARRAGDLATGGKGYHVVTKVELDRLEEVCWAKVSKRATTVIRRSGGGPVRLSEGITWPKLLDSDYEKNLTLHAITDTIMIPVATRSTCHAL